MFSFYVRNDDAVASHQLVHVLSLTLAWLDGVGFSSSFVSVVLFLLLLCLHILSPLLKTSCLLFFPIWLFFFFIVFLYCRLSNPPVACYPSLDLHPIRFHPFFLLLLLLLYISLSFCFFFFRPLLLTPSSPPPFFSLLRPLLRRQSRSFPRPTVRLQKKIVMPPRFLLPVEDVLAASAALMDTKTVSHSHRVHSFVR